MLNYSNLVGYAIEDEIANLYVRPRDQSARQRGALLHRPRHRPIDNFVSEFLPDVAATSTSRSSSSSASSTR